MEFEVSFSKAQRELSELLLLLDKAGDELDEMEKIGVRTNNRYTQSLKSTTAAINRTEQSLSKMTGDVEAVGKAMSQVRSQTAKFFSDIASGNAKASAEIQALKNSTSQLGQAIREQLANETYAKWLKKTATESANLRGENEHLRQSLDHLDNPHRRVNLRLQAMKDHLDRVTVASHKQQLENKELQQQLRLQATELGALNAQYRERIKGINQASTAEERQRNQLAELVRQYQSLHGGIGEQIAQQKALNQARDQEVTADTRLIAEVERLERQVAEYNTSLHAQKAVLNETLRQKQELATRSQREEADLEKLSRKLRELNENGYARQRLELNQQVQAKERLITENAREAASVEALERKLREVMSFRGQYKAQLQEQIREQERKSTQNQREAATLEELRTKLAGLEGGYEKQRVQLQEAVRQKEALIRAEQREGQELEKLQQQLREMDSARGREILQTREAIKAKRDEILETQKQTQAKERLERELRGLIDGEEREIAILKQRTQEQRRAVTEDERRQAAVRALRREMEYLHSAEGRAYIALQQQVAAQRAALTARQRHNNSIRAGNQLTASMRAGLAGLNSHIGMYTSSTIVAASATYALASAIRDTVSVGAEFTENMSRAEAVMFSASESSANAADQMRSLEMQVRALGQSTVFTASEVSGGLIELGMAGLTGGEAMMSLKPTLDLASIGMIEMSEAADIATNVMTTFKLSASDLPDVVNVMATAVTNSNTNIQQLANSLSYVGPAADSAGFSMRDTVSAIELLASSGIKGSKAGTGLRRSMLNLLNPTTKGAAVLDKYNISVLKADGSTRTLTDIMGQFNKALYNDMITPAERASAIVDLVGVRAQSAFSRMASSADELTGLREQLDNVAGAADRMRQTIEDNLTADWKQVRSAFEEIELTVFENFESQLRALSAATTVWLHDLKDVADVIGTLGQVDGFQAPNADGQMVDVTNLDVFIAKVELAAEAIPPLLAGLASFGAGGVFKSFGNDLKATSNALTNYQARTEAAAVATRSYLMAIRSASGPTAGMVTRLQLLAGASHYAAKGLNLAVMGVRGLAMAGRVLSAAFGWVGVIYSAYSMVQMLFGNDVADKITEQKDRVLEAKDAYKQYQEQVKQTQLQLNQAALTERLGTLERQLESTKGKIDEYARALETLREDQAAALAAGDEAGAQGLGRLIDRLTGKMEILGRQAGVTSEEIGSVGTSLEQLGVPVATLTDVQNRMDSLVAAMNNAEDASSGVDDELKELGVTAGMTGAEIAVLIPGSLQGRIAELRHESKLLEGVQHALRLSLSGTTDELGRMEGGMIGVTEQLRTMVGEMNRAHAMEQRFESLSNAGQQVVIEQRIRRVYEQSEDVDRQLEAGEIGADVAERRAADLQDQLEKLVETQQELRTSERDAASERDQAYADWNFQTMGQQEQTAHLRGEMDRLNTTIAEQERLRNADTSLYDEEYHAELVKERTKVHGQLTSMLERQNKEQGRAVGYTEELEKQNQLLRDISQAYLDYDSYVAQQQSALEVQQARNELLYAENLSIKERARLQDVAFNAQTALNASLERIRERSREIEQSEARILALKEQAANLTGKQRKDAEDAVNETLQGQKQLVADQLGDYRKLLDATVARTEELQSQSGDLREEKARVRLINEAAKAGQLISDDAAERILTLRKQNQQYRAIKAEVSRLQSAVESATGAERERLLVQLQASEQSLAAQSEYIDLLKEGEYELSHQAEALRAQAEAVEEFFSDAGDAIYDTLRDGFDDVDGMFDSIFDSFKDLLARMAYEAFINPIVVGMQQSVMGSMGLGGGGIQGGGGGGFGGLSTLGSMFTGNSIGYGMASMAGSLFGTSGQAAALLPAGSALNAGSVTAGQVAVGGSPLSGAAGIPNWQFGLAGLGGGLLGGSLFDGQYSGLAGSLGATGGMALGSSMAALGSFGGPIGALAGSVIGGALGSLFGGGKSRPSFQLSTVDTLSGLGGEYFENQSQGVYGEGAFGTVGFYNPGTKRLKSTFDGFENAQKFLQGIADMDSLVAGLAEDEKQLEAMAKTAQSIQFERVGSPQDISDQLFHRYAAIINETDSRLAASIITDMEELERTVGSISIGDGYRQAITRVEEITRVTLEDSLLKSMSELDPEPAINALVSVISMERIGDAIGGTVTDDIYDSLEGLEGDALTDQINSLKGAVEVLQLMDASAERLNLQFDTTAKGALTAADSLAQMAGGAQGLATVQQGYYQAVFSETERLSHSQADLAAQLSSVTDTVPSTTDELRAMVEAADLSTEAGREMALGLMQLAPAFAQTSDAVERAIAEAYQTSLDRAPDAAGLSYWMDEVMSGSITLEVALDRIANSAEATADASEDAAEALEDYADALKKKEDLERQLLRLQGDEEALRERQLDDLRRLAGAEEVGLIALQKRIWALEDEKNALDELSVVATAAVEPLTKAAADYQAAMDKIAAATEKSLSALNSVQGGYGDLRGQIDDALGISGPYMTYDGADERVREAVDNLNALAKRTADTLAKREEEMQQRQNKIDQLSSVESEEAQRLRDSMDDVRSQAEEAWRAQEELYQSQIDAAEAQQKAAEQLRQLYDSLQLASSSILNPLERLTEARSQYQEVLAAAQGGDTDAIGELRDVSRQYLEEAAGYYGQASGQYSGIWQSVTGSIDDMADEMAAESRSVESLLAEMAEAEARHTDRLESQLAAIEQQAQEAQRQAQEQANAAIETLEGMSYSTTGSLEALKEKIIEEEEKVRELMAKIESEKAEHEQEARQAVINALTVQVDTLDGINTLGSLMGQLPQNLARELAGIIGTDTSSGAVDPQGVYLDTGGFTEAQSAINDIYQSELGRNADQAGLAHWLDQLQGGQSLDEIQAAIAYDAAHGAHAQGLGNVPFDGYRAVLHQGEMVLPAPLANTIRSAVDGGKQDALIAEVRALREEVSRLRSERNQDASRASTQRERQTRELERNRRAKAHREVL